MNCWEFKDCGREPNGKNIALYGICPVTTESSVDGIHNGKNGGRCCWAIIPYQSTIENNLGFCCGGLFECIKCDFYKLVKDSTELIITV
ncbi:MAG: hypothetical protein WGN25_03155 [Candidatus Electrothrix sp. GW3-4]|uniref:two-CW domain-containing protein n=1 Tax=Candidatus Electrothrix sp. GW3-4 TaxID=3126740 RepID=UPI0030CA7041